MFVIGMYVRNNFHKIMFMFYAGYHTDVLLIVARHMLMKASSATLSDFDYSVHFICDGIFFQSGFEVDILFRTSCGRHIAFCDAWILGVHFLGDIVHVLRTCALLTFAFFLEFVFVSALSDVSTTTCSSDLLYSS